MRKFGIKYYSAFFGTGHLLYIGIMSYIYFTGEKDAQHQLFWIVPGIIDLPISLLILILASGDMIILSILHATLGSFQYAAIGWCIDYKKSQDRSSLLPKKRYLYIAVTLCIMLGYWAYSNISFSRLSEYDKSEVGLKNATSESERYYLLGDAAKSSFNAKKYDKARNYANELLALSQKDKNNCNYGNAIYDGHMVLGRIELLNGNKEVAVNHLFEAAKTPGSPTLNTFGPNMSLAKDLLDQDQRKPVIVFLIQCKIFWYDHKQVEDWIKEIQEGKIPDFGANLVY